MNYVYSALWFIIGVLLIVKFRSESKAIYALSVYFFILGIWWLVNELTAVDLMYGYYVWILRAISAAALIISGIVYYNEKNKIVSSDEKSEKDKKK